MQTGLAYFSSALSSELERALIQDIGVPIDLIEIRPGVSSGSGGVDSLTQLAAGWQIGKKTFLTFNAGFCPDLSQLSYKNLGAEPRVPLQQGVEAPERGRAHHPDAAATSAITNRLAAPACTRSASTSSGSGSSRWRGRC